MSYAQNYFPGYTGNQGYDPYAFESEEERRRREEEERLRIERETPVKQTIEIDPTTGAQKVKIEGSAYNLSSANPMTPTVSGPAVPEGVQVAGPADAAFERMRQVESGNRDYDAQGRPITSPKGAMFASQVMPSTAANPGYGVRPAASQTPEEYNRVGREYYDAMLKKFGGDERLAQAAYNAGPGRVDRAVQVASAQGGDALQYLPRETQQYPQKVAAVSPEQLAQQQQLAREGRPTEQQVAAMGQQSVPGVNMGGGTASTAQAAGAQTQQAQPQTFDDILNASQNDLGAMRKLLRSAPEQYQGVITDRILELAKREKEQAQVKQKVADAVASGDMRGIAREMNKNTQEGSLFKAFLLKTFGMEQAAQQENARALGTDVKYRTVRDPETGQSALVGFDVFTGMPKKGFDDTGVSLTPEQLSKLGAGAMGGKVTTGAEFFQDKKGNIYSPQRDEQGYTRMVNAQTNQVYSGAEPLQRLRDVAAVDVKAKTTAIQAAKERLMTDYNAGVKAFATTQQMLAETGQTLMTPQQLREAGVKEPDIQSIMRVVPAQGGAAAPAPAKPVPPAQAGAAATGVAAGQAVATGNVPAPQFPQVANAPAEARGAATAAGGGTTPVKPRTVQEQKRMEAEEKGNREIDELGRKEIVKAASGVLAEQSKIITDLNANKRNLKILESGRTNFGTIISGQIPGERAIEGFFKTEDAIRTKNVMEQINKIAAINSKMLGVNPTDRDLQFVTENIPDVNWAEKDVADWIRRSDEASRRTLDIAKKQVKSGGTYLAPVPEEEPVGKPAAAPTTYNDPEKEARYQKYKREQQGQR